MVDPTTADMETAEDIFKAMKASNEQEKDDSRYKKAFL